MTRPDRQAFALWTVLVLALCLNIVFWTKSKSVIETWDNVPVAPGAAAVRAAALGDTAFGYRLVGYTLQNLGNTGGRYEPLKSYNYTTLKELFFLANRLDPQANYVPFMAAYMFGPVEGITGVSDVIDYLKVQGREPYPEKWRWSAQAVYLARYFSGDQEYALTLANELAKMPDTAPWARQMPAFINLNMGNKDAAYAIMLEMLKSEGDKLDPAEIYAMLDFMCNRTLDREAAAQNPLCEKFQ